MSKKDKKFAETLFEALSDPEQSEMFSLEGGEIGDVEGYFITATGKSGEAKPVALVLTPAVRELLKEALDELFEADDGEDEDEDEPTARRARGSLWDSL